jgi:hypothetical protein
MKRPRPWLCRLRMLLLCLLLGVVLTVGVAWGAALVCQKGSWTRGRRPVFAILPTDAPDDIFVDWLDAPASSSAIWVDRNGFHQVWIHGFPSPSLGTRYRWNTRSGFFEAPLVERSGSVWWRGLAIREHSGSGWVRMRPTSLPLMPLWPGFAIDVALHAVLSWLLCFAPFTLRRVLRARRGRCLGCGYDMRGLDACPECGAEA